MRWNIDRGTLIGCSGHLIQIYDEKRVVIECCKKVIDFSRDCIVIEGGARVKICGKNLSLKELGGGNLQVEGLLFSLEFLPKSRAR